MILLSEFPVGHAGFIKKIAGGYGLQQKMDTMGLQIGKRVKVTSRQWGHGPVIIQYGNTEIAIGFRMAEKILIEKDK
ncbi:MAG: FeoA family protein [Spirochaetota bacterium]